MVRVAFTGKNEVKEEKKEAEIVKQVLDDNRLRYYFQPIVNARNGEVLHMRH